MMKHEPCVDDVLVVWCATRLQGDATMVGWYKHATVWRITELDRNLGDGTKNNDPIMFVKCF